MEKIVIFGKGGIGKSTIAANLSYCYAKSGRKVLHIGCDPKSDSTLCLTHGKPAPTVIEQYFIKGAGIAADQIISSGIEGIDCVESGGPEPGVGCGGRGISLMIDIFTDLNIVGDGNYDVAIYDILGDVVCGGFAAPLRLGLGEKVIIVVSEELMSLYAANNIARAVKTYEQNGIVLAGLVLNLRDNTADTAHIEEFARRLNTNVIGTVRRDPLIRDALYEYKTVMEFAPESESASIFTSLANKILGVRTGEMSSPTPMDRAGFDSFTKSISGGAAKKSGK